MRLRLPDRQPVDYQVARDNHTWRDHMLRVQMTASLLAWLNPVTVIDPACGDGSIVAAAHALRPMEGAYLADISRPNFYKVGTEMRPVLPPNLRVACQTIEETLRDPFTFDVVVLTEILEHVEDPVEILKMARDRATFLVASSPFFMDEATLDVNHEHLWQFDISGYSEMLEEAGWTGIVTVPIHLTEFMYDFQLWAAK